MRTIGAAARSACLALPLAATACGGHADKSTPTLSVTCGGTLRLAGAASIDVSGGQGGTTLSFPDPVNPGHTGTLPLDGGAPCTITPELGKHTTDAAPS